MAPFFNTSSPFDQVVEKATDEKSLTDNWTLILDICERVQKTPNGSKDCLKSIVKRLNHKVPFVALQTLTLLDSCVQNCGITFHIEIANKDFISNCRVLINTKAHPKVAKVLKDLVQKWAQNEFSSNPLLANIPEFYESLKSSGYFPNQNSKSKKNPVTTTLKNTTPSTIMDADSIKEQDDFEKAIALSLAEENNRSKTAASSSAKGNSGPVYPGISSTNTESSYGSNRSAFSSQEPTPSNIGFPDTKMVRALFDFEAAEDNELTFKAGEIICILDDSNVSWWKGSNSSGEGLFPANFVTKNLDEQIIPEVHTIKKDTKSVGFKEEPIVVKKLLIDEVLIDKALTKIQNVDPSSLTQDTQEMINDEQHCMAMQPLIDSKLQHIDKKYNDLMELNGKVLNALQLYSSLMRETPLYGSGLNNAGQVPAHTSGQQYRMPPQQYQQHQPIVSDQSVPGMGPTPIQLGQVNPQLVQGQAFIDQVVPGQYGGQMNIGQIPSVQMNHLPLDPGQMNTLPPLDQGQMNPRQGVSGNIAPVPNYHPNEFNPNQNNSSNIHDYSSMYSSLPPTSQYQPQ